MMRVLERRRRRTVSDRAQISQSWAQVVRAKAQLQFLRAAYHSRPPKRLRSSRRPPWRYT